MIKNQNMFDRAVTAVIGVNSALLVWGLIERDEIAEHLELGCLVFFVGELVVRLGRSGWDPARFIRQPWTVFDVVVVAVSLLPLLGADASVLRLAKLSRMAHWLRHVSHLELHRLVTNRHLTAGQATAVVMAAVLAFTAPPAASAEPGTDVLAGITVAPYVHRGDYRRAAFGEGWDNGTGCDVRDQVLNRDLTDVTDVSMKRCPETVESGTLHDPYTGKVIAFTRGARTGASVEIDHIVPLAYAWDMGAWGWPDVQRRRFYFDASELLAVDGPTNQAKGDLPPGRWMPPNAAYGCEYVTKFTNVLRAYNLPIDPASAPVVQRAAATCPAG